MKNTFKKVLSFIYEIVKVFALSFTIVFVLMKFIIMPCVVDGKSMLPNYHDGDVCYSFIITKNISIKRFDTSVVDVDDKLLLKRVIGLPNETLEYIDNKLYINGEYIEEEFLGDVNTDDFKIELHDDEYFCLGDNRDISKDSRYYGPFSKSQIKATHLFVLYPLSNFGVSR